MSWILLSTGFQPGEINMKVDSLLAEWIRPQEGVSVLRVYGWNPPAISIGYNQEEDEFDRSKLAEQGIDIVRRPTGGRAILHWNEITYSVVTHLERSSLKEIYHTLNCALLEGVRSLGINAELIASGNSTQQLYQQSVSAACFSSSAKSEIQFGGRKLVGSAQRRLGEVVLQHGSLLLGPQHLQLASLIAEDSPERKILIWQSLADHAIDAETILGHPVDFEEAALHLKEGFEHSLGVSFQYPPSSLLSELQAIMEEFEVQV